jgi:hypothetical protein
MSVGQLPDAQICYDEWNEERCYFTILDGVGPRTVNTLLTAYTQAPYTQGTFGTRQVTTAPSNVSSWALNNAATETYTDATVTDATGHMFQPFVVSECWHVHSQPNLNDSSAFVEFGPHQRYLDGVLPLHWLSSNSSQNMTGQSEYVIVHGSSDQDTQSPTYVSFHAPPAHVSNITALMTTVNVDDGMDACAVAAHWLEMKTNYTYGIISIAKDSPSFELRFRTAQAAKTSLSWLIHALEISVAANNSGSPIGDWVTVAALAMANLPSPSYAPAYFDLTPDGAEQTAWSNSWGTTPPTLPREQELLIIAYCKENGYFRAYDRVRLYPSTVNWTDPAALDRFVIHLLQSGYGYNSAASTVCLSLAVVFLYVCVASIYTLYTLITGHTATSWNSIAEIMALALNSQRTDVLKNTSVGIGTLSTFRKPISVRVNEHDSLELVFSDGKEEAVSTYREVVTNEKY